MQQTQVRRVLRQSACAVAVLGLALPVLAQMGNPATRPADQMGASLNRDTMSNAGEQYRSFNSRGADTQPSEATNEPMRNEGTRDEYRSDQSERGERNTRDMRGREGQWERNQMRETTRWRESGREGFGGQPFGEFQRYEGQVSKIVHRRIFGREHTFAWIDTGNNQRTLVNLGPDDQVQRELANLHEGDRISVMAYPMPVIAEQVEYNGQKITLKRGPERFGREMGGRFAEAANERYSGEIVSTRRANFVGFDQSHLLARVRLEDENWQPVIDLGPAQDVNNLDLRAGDRISVVARNACINGEAGLIADELRTPNGQFVQLDNAPQEPGQLRGRPVGPNESERGGFREGRSGMRERTYEQERTRERTMERGAGNTQPSMRDRGTGWEGSSESGTRSDMNAPTTRPSSNEQMNQQNPSNDNEMEEEQP